MSKKVIKETVDDNSFAALAVSQDFRKISPGLRDVSAIDRSITDIADYMTTMKQLESLEANPEGDGGLEDLLGIPKENPREPDVRSDAAAEDVISSDGVFSEEDPHMDAEPDPVADDTFNAEELEFSDLSKRPAEETTQEDGQEDPQEDIREIAGTEAEPALESPDEMLPSKEAFSPEVTDIDVDDLEFSRVGAEEVMRNARASGMTILPENHEKNESETDMSAEDDVAHGDPGDQDDVHAEQDGYADLWAQELEIVDDSPPSSANMKDILSRASEAHPDEDHDAFEDVQVSWERDQDADLSDDLLPQDDDLEEDTETESLWGDIPETVDSGVEEEEVREESGADTDPEQGLPADQGFPELETVSEVSGLNIDTESEPNTLADANDGEWGVLDNSEKEAALTSSDMEDDLSLNDEAEEIAPKASSRRKKILMGTIAASFVVIAGSAAFFFAGPGGVQQQPQQQPQQQAEQIAPPAVFEEADLAIVGPEISDPDFASPDVSGPADEARAEILDPEAPVDDFAVLEDEGSLFDMIDDGLGMQQPGVPEDSVDPLQELTAGSTFSDESMDLSDLFLGGSDAMAEPVEAAVESLEDLPPVVALSDFEAVIASIETLDANAQDLFDLAVAQSESIASLEASLALALERAERAESLAIAQNQVLVRFVAAEEKLEIAEQLIVDLSRRVAAVEGVDAADRDEVDVRLTALDNQLRGLQRDVGMVARMTINGSPTPVAGRSPGSANADRAENVALRSPVADPANVPANAAVGDFVNGYGTVLEIFATSDGGRMVVMENGSVIQN